MTAFSGIPPTSPGHFSDPQIMEAIVSTLIGRVQNLEAWTRENSTTASTGPKSESQEQVGQQPAPVPANETNASTSTATKESDATTGLEDSENVELAHKILDIVASYGTSSDEGSEKPYQVKKLFLPTVLKSIKEGTAIKLVLPAFPFKSPNRQNKVLGTLPDLGEEVALANIQSLCDSIHQVYEGGADCYITSDGLVYNGQYCDPRNHGACS
jgi:hypothetical protein